jgi:hypothetical protein
MSHAQRISLGLVTIGLYVGLAEVNSEDMNCQNLSSYRIMVSLFDNLERIRQ